MRVLLPHVRFGPVRASQGFVRAGFPRLSRTSNKERNLAKTDNSTGRPQDQWLRSSKPNSIGYEIPILAVWRLSTERSESAENAQKLRGIN
jgi:hypothetical protein